jgi:DNA-binding PadR family transcriptional regulator
MKTRVYLILLALADGERHGLAIARDVRQLSGGTARLWPATLYGSLEELLDSGWIEELDTAARRPANESEKKRFYRLTPAGRQVLADETDRLSNLVKAARSRMRPRARSTP